MKNSVIAIPSFVITMIVYTINPVFFQMSDNLFGVVNHVVSDEQNIKALTYNQQQPQIQQVEKDCKSFCPKSTEMCIAMCA